MLIIYYDLETTGLNYKLNSIHQLSGIVEHNGVVVDTFNFDMAPHKKAIIEPSALAVSNRTQDQINSFPSQKDTYKAFLKYLGRYIDRFNPKDKAFLCGFNNRSFDDDFLRKWFELCNDPFINSWFWPNTLDTLVLATQYLMSRRTSMENFQLPTVAKELGIIVEKTKLHNSSYDVELTRKIYRIVTGVDVEI